MDKDILFDNIYIGHSVEDADKFAQETFHVKHPIEQLLEIESRPKDEDKPIKSQSDLVFMDDPVLYVKEKLDLFFTIAKTNPIEAVKFVPEAAGGLAAVLITVLTILISLISMGTSSPAPQVKKAAAGAKSAAVNAKDKTAEAVASGAEQVKEQVNKRATRSTT
jgi:calnexin